MKNLFIAFSLILILSSCSSTTLGVVVTNSDFKRITISEKPPQDVTNTKQLTSLNNYDFRAVSISPAGVYSVISLFKPSNFKTRLEIYNSINGDLIKSFSSNDLKNLIENNSSAEYPSSMETFITFSVRWQTNKNVILEVQPVATGTELTPQNVTMVYNLQTKTVLSIDYYGRGDSSPVSSGTFNQKGIYNFEVSNGNLIIDGNIIQNAPSSIKHADISTIKK